MFLLLTIFYYGHQNTKVIRILGAQLAAGPAARNAAPAKRFWPVTVTSDGLKLKQS